MAKKKPAKRKTRALAAVYCVDVDVAKPEVGEFSGEELQKDLEFFGVKDPLDLADPDRHIFRTAREAEAFLKKYKAALKFLKAKYKGSQSDAPCMLYKRRYLVQTFLGMKMSTQRHYRKDWKPGQVFQLHDQTIFLPVRLKKISKKSDSDGVFYQYDFTNIAREK